MELRFCQKHKANYNLFTASRCPICVYDASHKKEMKKMEGIKIKKIKYRGEEKTLRQWSLFIGCARNTLIRYKEKYGIENGLTMLINKYNKIPFHLT